MYGERNNGDKRIADTREGRGRGRACFQRSLRRGQQRGRGAPIWRGSGVGHGGQPDIPPDSEAEERLAGTTSSHCGTQLDSLNAAHANPCLAPKPRWPSVGTYTPPQAHDACGVHGGVNLQVQETQAELGDAVRQKGMSRVSHLEEEVRALQQQVMALEQETLQQQKRLKGQELVHAVAASELVQMQCQKLQMLLQSSEDLCNSYKEDKNRLLAELSQLLAKLKQQEHGTRCPLKPKSTTPDLPIGVR